ncbi:MAG: phosphoethanolamine--lipid A transferase [Betaproteobacteria bacterium]|nr:phosphoethanolamine--lipid A transferase [Betaproteobacteria bacterium]
MVSPTPSPRAALRRSVPSAREGRNPLTIAALLSLWLAGPANWPLWDALYALPDVQGWRGVSFALALGGMVAAALFLLLIPLAWRWTFKPAIALLLLAAAVDAHFMGNYGVVLDPTMVRNMLQTDVREVRDLLSGQLLLSCIVLAGLPLWWVLRTQVNYQRWPVQLARNGLGALGALGLIVVLLLASFQDLSSTMRNHTKLRYLINPLDIVYSLGRVAYLANTKPKGPPAPIGLDATVAMRLAGARPPLVLLVVGEAARADHFSLNGYARNTNPELQSLDVLSFRNVLSCGTNTAASVPCMFSHLGRIGYEARNHDYENLLDLLQRAGVAVLWLDNQAGCKGVCDRVPHAAAQEPAPGGAQTDATLCPHDECFDEALLSGLTARFEALPVERRARGVVLVMHQMGSHGPAYWQRSPSTRKPFQPECTSNALQQCEQQQLINSYDNSIAYTDHVLASAIGWLKGQSGDYDPALLYVSDHGESLGENNLYLHGLPYAIAPHEQKHVPMIAWLPSGSAGPHGLDATCLRGLLDAPLSHDHLFHTMLGLARIAASEYRSVLDAFSPCRRL